MYSKAADYSVEFFTPPYDYLAAPGSTYPRAPRLLPGGGLAACCSSCATGGGCEGKGVGVFDGSMSDWGFAEYAVIGIVGYAAFSMIFTTRRAASAVRGGARSIRRAARSRKRQSLERQLAALGDE